MIRLHCQNKTWNYVLIWSLITNEIFFHWNYISYIILICVIGLKCWNRIWHCVFFWCLITKNIFFYCICIWNIIYIFAIRFQYWNRMSKCATIWHLILVLPSYVDRKHAGLTRYFSEIIVLTLAISEVTRYWRVSHLNFCIWVFLHVSYAHVVSFA